MDYTFIDADAINAAEIKGKALVINGYAVECLILPRTEVLSVKVAEKLNAWKKAGGTMIWWEEKADVSAETGKEAALRTLLADHVVTMSVDEVTAKAKAALADPLQLTASDKTELFVSRHKLQDSVMYFLINNHETANQISLSYAGATSFDVYDNETGAIKTITGDDATITIEPYRSVFVVVN